MYENVHEFFDRSHKKPVVISDRGIEGFTVYRHTNAPCVFIENVNAQFPKFF